MPTGVQHPFGWTNVLPISVLYGTAPALHNRLGGFWPIDLELKLTAVRNRFSELRKEDGQALVEFALVIPLLIFVIFAIIDFGLAINQYNDATNLANLGARATAVLQSTGTGTTPATCVSTSGSTTSTSTTLVGYIQCYGSQDNPALKAATVTVCDPSGTTTIASGDSVSVKVQSNFNWLGTLQGGIGSVGGLGNLNSNISSTATMRMEGSGNSSSGWFSGATLATSGC